MPELGGPAAAAAGAALSSGPYANAPTVHLAGPKLTVPGLRVLAAAAAGAAIPSVPYADAPRVHLAGPKLAAPQLSAAVNPAVASAALANAPDMPVPHGHTPRLEYVTPSAPPRASKIPMPLAPLPVPAMGPAKPALHLPLAPVAASVLLRPPVCTGKPAPEKPMCGALAEKLSAPGDPPGAPVFSTASWPVKAEAAASPVVGGAVALPAPAPAPGMGPAKPQKMPAAEAAVGGGQVQPQGLPAWGAIAAASGGESQNWLDMCICPLTLVRI